MVGFRSLIPFILVTLHVIADKYVYYIVGHGGHTDPAIPGKTAWTFDSNVNFFQDLGVGMCQADVQLRNLIDLEMAEYETVMGRVKWVVTKNKAYNKPPIKKVHEIPSIWVAPIENPYGGVFQVQYDNDMKEVKGVTQYIKWPEYATNSDKYFQLRDIVNYIEKTKSLPAGEIFWLACLTTLDYSSQLKEPLVDLKPNSNVRDERTPQYKKDLKALKDEVRTWATNFKEPDDYNDWIKEKFSKDPILKKAFDQFDLILKEDDIDKIYSNTGDLNELYKKEMKSFFGYQHIRAMRIIFNEKKDILADSYKTWKDLKNKVQSSQTRAMAVSGDSYPSQGHGRADASELDEDGYAFEIDDGSGYSHHAHYGRAGDKRSDRYYHQYGGYEPHDHRTDYTLIAVMTTFIGIGGCCLCIIIAIVCGVISGRYYYMNKNQRNSKHNRGQYGRIDVDENQV